MSQLEKATLEVSGWKQHVCVACASTFRYRMSRTKTGLAPTLELARERAKERCLAALRRETEPHPCPNCGNFQPSMFVHRRCLGHLLVFLVTLAFTGIPLAITFIFFEHVAQLERLCSVALSVWTCLPASMIYLAAAAAHVWFALQNPNRDPEANKCSVGREAREVALAFLELGDPQEAVLPPRFSGLGRLRWLALLVMLVGAFLPGAVEVVRVTQGWHANPGWFPTVVGIGETSRWYTDHSITAVNSLWANKTSTEIVNASDLGLEHEAVVARTQNSQWDREIFTKQTAGQHSYIWFDVEFPADDRLVNQTLDIALESQITYPKPVPKSRYLDTKEQIFERMQVTISPRSAGFTYSVLWWGAMTVSLCGYVLAGGRILLVDDHLRLRGWRTECFFAETEAPNQQGA